MTKKILILIFGLILTYTAFSIAKSFWRGETMSRALVEKKWGQTPFDSNKFRQGDEKVKASMAASLLSKEKEFIGKDRSQIRQELGDHDGFYFTDMYPAYLIQTAKNHSEEAWQIVFLLDRKQKVSEIIVHKNCCKK